MAFLPVEMLESRPFDSLTRVLLDKDGLIPDLPDPGERRDSRDRWVAKAKTWRSTLSPMTGGSSSGPAPDRITTISGSRCWQYTGCLFGLRSPSEITIDTDFRRKILKERWPSSCTSASFHGMHKTYIRVPTRRTFNEAFRGRFEDPLEGLHHR